MEGLTDGITRDSGKKYQGLSWDEAKQRVLSAGTESEKVLLLMHHVTLDEILHYRNATEGAHRHKPVTKEVMSKDVEKVVRTLSIGAIRRLGNLACKASVSSTLTPFNAMVVLNRDAYACSVSKVNEGEQSDTPYVYEFEKAKEIVRCPTVCFFPDPRKFSEKGYHVVGVLPPLVRLSAAMANYASVVSGALKYAATPPKLEATLGIKQAGWNRFVALIEHVHDMGNLLGDTTKSYSGLAHAHVVYMALLAICRDQNKRAEFVEMIRTVSLRGGNRLMDATKWYNITPAFPSNIDGIDIDYANQKIDEITCYKIMTLMRTFRGDNSTSRGEITRSSYTVVNLPGHDADRCTEAADYRELFRNVSSIAIWGKDSQHITPVLKALVLTEEKRKVFICAPANRIQGIKPVYLTEDLNPDGTVKEEKGKRKTPDHYSYGDYIRVYIVSENFITLGDCPITGKRRGQDVVVLDRRGANEPGPTMLAYDNEFSNRLLELKAMGAPFVTKVRYYGSLLDECDDLEVYSSCEYHNMTVYVSSYELKNRSTARAPADPKAPRKDWTYIQKPWMMALAKRNITTWAWRSVLCSVTRAVMSLTGVSPFAMLSAYGVPVPSMRIEVVNMLRKTEYAAIDMIAEGLRTGTMDLNDIEESTQAYILSVADIQRSTKGVSNSPYTPPEAEEEEDDSNDGRLVRGKQKASSSSGAAYNDDFNAEQLAMGNFG